MMMMNVLKIGVIMKLDAKKKVMHMTGAMMVMPVLRIIVMNMMCLYPY
jgi:hypothetical protein